MMKSRQYSRNLAKRGLLLSLFILTLLFSGCSSSIAPTFTREQVSSAIEKICKTEHNIDVKSAWFDNTLWIYYPVDAIFTKAKKPAKKTELFSIEKIKCDFKNNNFRIFYAIKSTPPKETSNDIDIDPEVTKNLGNIWIATRRVLFSVDRSKGNEPNFICVLTADITNGFEITLITNYLDLKKLSYNSMAHEEYQHRTIQDANIDPAIINDKEGLHVKYREITIPEFICKQIEHRIKLKFQKPEVKKDADIDKEVIKIISYVIKIYNFSDFNSVEAYNLVTRNKTFLNKQAILAKPTD